MTFLNRNGSQQYVSSVEITSPLYSVDMIKEICKHVSVRDILTMCLVCKQWLYSVTRYPLILYGQNEFHLVALSLRYYSTYYFEN